MYAWRLSGRLSFFKFDVDRGSFSAPDQLRLRYTFLRAPGPAGTTSRNLIRRTKPYTREYPLGPYYLPYALRTVSVWLWGLDQSKTDGRLTAKSESRIHILYF